MTFQPNPNLPPAASRWGSWITDLALNIMRDQGRLRDTLRSLQSAQRGTSARQGTSIQELSQTVGDLVIANERVSAAQSSISAVQDQLLEMAKVYSASFNDATRTNTAGWAANPIEVNLVSTTGRIEVQFGGSMNGGNAYFCYDVTAAQTGTIVDRAAVRDDPSRRLAISGGASFSPSGYRSLVVGVPRGESIRVRLQLFAEQEFVTFIGGQLTVRSTA